MESKCRHKNGIDIILKNINYWKKTVRTPKGLSKAKKLL